MGPHVLIVDANVEDVASMSATLEARGFVVEVAADGARALSALEHARPDLVLLDVDVAAVTGMEVLDRIRANPQLAAMPVIIVTARTDDDDLLAGYKFGADYYLTKPVSARRLLRGVGLVLGREFPE